MLIRTETGCIASGRVVKNGGELKFAGKVKVPIYKFTIVVGSWKDNAGEWHNKYLDCEFFGGEAVKNAPKVEGGNFVLCTGFFERKNYVRPDGSVKIIEKLKCEYCSIENSGNLIPSTDEMDPEDAVQFEEVNGEELPM